MGDDATSGALSLLVKAAEASLKEGKNNADGNEALLEDPTERRRRLNREYKQRQRSRDKAVQAMIRPAIGNLEANPPTTNQHKYCKYCSR